MSSYGWERNEADDGTVVVALSGELDLTNARELEHRLAAACTPDARLAVDLNRVCFVDSAALHVLFKIARQQQREGLVVLLEPDASIAPTLAIVGLDRVAQVRATLEPLAARTPPDATV